MTHDEFRNLLLTMFNIDGCLLPELNDREKADFVHNPVLFFFRCTCDQRAAIWREMQKRHASYLMRRKELE